MTTWSGMAGGWDWVLTEGSKKGAKGARAGDVHSSHSSVLPSAEPSLHSVSVTDQRKAS